MLPLLVDMNRAWSNTAWEDPEKVVGRDRRQAALRKRRLEPLQGFFSL